MSCGLGARVVVAAGGGGGGAAVLRDGGGGGAGGGATGAAGGNGADDMGGVSVCLYQGFGGEGATASAGGAGGGFYDPKGQDGAEGFGGAGGSSVAPPDGGGGGGGGGGDGYYGGGGGQGAFCSGGGGGGGGGGSSFIAAGAVGGVLTGDVQSGDGQVTITYQSGPSYSFGGFSSPVNNPPTPNVVKAGSAIPVRFSLGGDQGLAIFSAGYPASGAIPCDVSAPPETVEPTMNAGGSGLTYDPAVDTYTYVWKTDKAWANTCRQLVLKLSDGTSHVVNFDFRG